MGNIVCTLRAREGVECVPKQKFLSVGRKVSAGQKA